MKKEKETEQRAVSELYICVKDKEGKVGWIPMTEFGKLFLETVGETIDLTLKEVGEEINILRNRCFSKKER